MAREIFQSVDLTDWQAIEQKHLNATKFHLDFTLLEKDMSVTYNVGIKPIDYVTVSGDISKKKIFEDTISKYRPSVPTGTTATEAETVATSLPAPILNPIKAPTNVVTTTAAAKVTTTTTTAATNVIHAAAPTNVLPSPVRKGIKTRKVTDKSSIATHILPNNVRLEFLAFPLGQIQADAIVNAANSQLKHCSGIAGAIRISAGNQLINESNAIVRRKGSIKVGECVSTTNGKMKNCKRVIHAVGPEGKVYNEKDCYKYLKNAYTNSCLLAEQENLQSIAFVPISAQIYQVQLRIIGLAFFMAINELCNSGQLNNIKSIILFDKNYKAVNTIRNDFEKYVNDYSLAEKEFGLLTNQIRPVSSSQSMKS